MEVEFVKRGTGYLVHVRRDRGPELAPRNGPGGCTTVPHDAAHLLVEIEAGLRGGVFGRLAAADGLDGLFWPADPGERRRAARHRRTPTREEAADQGRSEYLASLTVPLWEVARGLRAPDPVWPGAPEDADLAPELRERIFARYDEFAARWRELPAGGGITVRWPRSPARVGRGRATRR